MDPFSFSYRSKKLIDDNTDSKDKSCNKKNNNSHRNGGHAKIFPNPMENLSHESKTARGNGTNQDNRCRQQNDITASGINQSQSHILDQSDTQMNIDGPSFSNEKPELQQQPENSNNMTSMQNTFENSDANNESTMSQKLWATFFVIVLLWLPSIINYSFSLFMCTSYEDGYTYLKKDTSIKCWQGRDLLL